MTPVPISLAAQKLGGASRQRAYRQCIASLDVFLERRRNNREDKERRTTPAAQHASSRLYSAGSQSHRKGSIGSSFPAQSSLPSHINIRSISSASELIPEFAQHWTVWGASGWLLKTLHWGGAVPYWACFSITNVIVRTSLVPLVLQSAHTATRFAKVAPEVQFLVTIFQNDMRKQRAEGAPLREQRMLISKTLQTLRGIYKLHDIHPLAIFKSPLMQIPIYWYFSIGLRKIINGADPELAQQLTESSFLWITDLTEPDPWYGLPVLAGTLLYLNVEVAMGRKSLSGENTSKSNVAIVLKDFFQSLAVFMPCFMSQSPAGIQIYLATSFVFTLGQGAALRNDTFRGMVGLPTATSPKSEATFANEFIELKRMEEEAREAWGDSEVQGKGVLAVGLETSFPGTARPSTIQGSNTSLDNPLMVSTIGAAPHMQVTNVDTTPKVYAPPQEFIKEQVASKKAPAPASPETQVLERSGEELMEAANRGELLEPLVVTTSTKKKAEKKFDAKRFVKRKRKGSKKPRK